MCAASVAVALIGPVTAAGSRSRAARAGQMTAKNQPNAQSQHDSWYYSLTAAARQLYNRPDLMDNRGRMPGEKGYRDPARDNRGSLKSGFNAGDGRPGVGGPM